MANIRMRLELFMKICCVGVLVLRMLRKLCELLYRIWEGFSVVDCQKLHLLDECTLRQGVWPNSNWLMRF